MKMRLIRLLREVDSCGWDEARWCKAIFEELEVGSVFLAVWTEGWLTVIFGFTKLAVVAEELLIILDGKARHYLEDRNLLGSQIRLTL
jgi:hypothetical protein